MQTNTRAIIIVMICSLFIFTSYKFYRHQYIPSRQKAPKTIITQIPLITDNSWVWLYTEKSNGTKVTASSSEFILSFIQNGSRIHSTTDCNLLDSTYTQNGKVLRITGFAFNGTRFCKISQEAVYGEELQSATSYIIVRNELHINLKDGGVMVFSRFKEVVIEKEHQGPPEGTTAKEQEMSFGQKKYFGGISIELMKLTGDSRCPKDVTCIQKGHVTVSLGIRQDDELLMKDLSEDGPPIIFEGYTVSITKVIPDKLASKEITAKDYRITIKVSP